MKIFLYEDDWDWLFLVPDAGQTDQEVMDACLTKYYMPSRGAKVMRQKVLFYENIDEDGNPTSTFDVTARGEPYIILIIPKDVTDEDV